MTMSDTKLSENFAFQGSGGALSVLGPHVLALSITSTNFSGNIAVGNGGAVDARHIAQTSLDHVFFEHNTAEGFGGAFSASAVSIGAHAVKHPNLKLCRCAVVYCHLP